MTTPTAPIPYPIDPDDQEKQREELAMLEGHDADIRVYEQPTTAIDYSIERQSSPSPVDTDSTKVKDEEAGRPSSGSKNGAEHKQEEDTNPNVVFWDGPDDPDNPVNWKASLKWGNVAAISAITFIT